jgi:UDP-glucose 4-epimerase
MRPVNVPARVLVTGGAGFIGSHVVDRLVAAGAEVVVVDDLSSGDRGNVPSGVSFVRLDLASPDAIPILADIRPTAVVHSAAQTSVAASVHDPVGDARSNVVGSLALITACRLAGVAKFVYLTTGGALYGGSDRTAHDERAAISPMSPYGVSKWTVESYLRILPPADSVTVLRLSNVYGPRQRATGEGGVVATFADRMLRDLPVVIDGDGEQTRDMLFVSDAVDAVEAALNRDVAGAFNIGTGTRTSVNELFEALSRLTASARLPTFGPGRPGDIRHSVLNPTLARDVLGWQATTTLESGLAATVESQRLLLS